MNFVTSFIGNPPPYWTTCINQIRLFSNKPVWCITDHDISNPVIYELSKIRNVIIVPYKSFNENNRFITFQECISRNNHKIITVDGLGDRKHLFMRSMERFILCELLVRKEGLRDTIFLEIDNMVYMNPELVLSQLKQKELAYLYDNDGRSSAGIMFIRDPWVMEDLSNMIISYIETGESHEWLTDMGVLAKYATVYPYRVQYLPIEIDRSYPNEVYGGSGDYSCIFDAAPYGIYLFGQDPFHTNGKLVKGLKNIWSKIDVTHNTYEWKFDDMGRKCPWVTFKNGESRPIFNLHIHAKNLEEAVSDNVKSVDKVFIIHYNKLNDRKLHMIEQLKRNNITNYKFIETYNRDTTPETFFDDKFRVNKYKISHAVKCVTMSHIDVYKQVVDKDYKTCLILEDDAIFDDNFAVNLHKYLSTTPDDFDIGCLTNCYFHPDKIEDGVHWYRSDRTRTTAGYVITKRACEKILTTILPFENPIDFQLFEEIKKHSLNTYYAEPTLINQGTFNGWTTSLSDNRYEDVNPKVYFHKRCTWESDYLKNEIFQDYEFVYFDDIDKIDINQNDILIVNTITKKDVLNKIDARLVVYLSDECKENEFQPDEKQTIFKQYNFFTENKSVFQIPLGYAKGYLSNQLPLKPMNIRKYNIAFIGEMKENRWDMLNVFQREQNAFIQQVKNTWNIDTLPMSPSKTYEIYSDSKFVLCGRGNATLDSFRIYEAIVAGAIPIVVGERQEYVDTFWYDGDIPLVLFAPTWEDAYTKYLDILTDNNYLDSIQSGLLSWWKRVHYRLRKQIEK